MKKILFYIVIVFAMLGAFGAFTVLKNKPQKIPIPLITEINSMEDIVKPYIENDKTKGLSIGTYKDGEIEFYNFGICGDKNPIVPSEKSIYEIGSITKTFTAAVLAQMVMERKVNYGDRIATYLPEEIVNWPVEVSITLEELATHSSSLPRIPSNLIIKAVLHPSNPYKTYSVEDMYDFLKDFKPAPKSERKSDYSNLGVGLLGHILANIDSVSYEAMIQKRIFQPLGMDNSCIEIAKGQLIQGHDGNGNPTSPWDLPTLAGAGAIRSNTTDMMKYLVANINGEVPFVLTHNPRIDLSQTRKRGLAWSIQQNGNLEITWHNGGTGGFRTFTGFSKEEKVGVIVMANSVQSVDAVGIRILQFLTK